ncbi:nuclear pore complex protein NUP133 [Actinidia eriantha]|uniref:nuclear pore complex protein NUP133 n=1 Tax=Actinidia eriantha TaxID=165200 RepID=UPI0025848126|nr:nuclear pore complex protein NUP133 [Actinidia eriantha]
MFSPATRKSNFSARKDRSLHAPPDSPLTPLAENRRPLHENSVPNRPSTGTPAPWASRLSVLARISPVKKSEKVEDLDPVQPVFVGEFPQLVRDEQAILLQKRVPGDFCLAGGMEKETSLAWIIFGDKLFVWSYLSLAASRNCVVLNLPSSILEDGESGRNSCPGNSWMLYIVNWDGEYRNTDKVVQQCKSAGIVLCNQRTRALVYWPDIYSEGRSSPVTSVASIEELEMSYLLADGKTTPNRQQHHSRPVSSSTGSCLLNSLIGSAIPDDRHTCVALACGCNGELWLFYCTPTGIHRKKIYQDILSSSYQGNDSGQLLGSKGYPRSLLWCFSHCNLKETNRQFFLLTDHEIQCFSITLSPDITVVKVWSHEIIGADGDSGIQKNLAGQKRIWPLDLQVDNQGKVITILIATFCKDRLSSSSYIEYSLLTMQYRSGVNISPESIVAVHERVLEKKAPIQVIIPKARVEEEDFLFSMRLRVGGKPSGSAIVLSGDGTATVSHYWRSSTRLYQFDLPYDAGKVLDASVFPSSDDEDGAWAVLTEKAGVWAIPEKAVLLGGVEPPERSLSRKGSSNEISAQEERRNLLVAGNIAPRRAGSEAWDAGDRQRAVFTGIARRTAQDEESEALLNHLFHDFILSGQVDVSLDKLRSAGAFERDGETNVFARVSKSIVDTLAKHWTTTRGAEIVALAVVSTQLMDKQQKHQKFLQFLALSKCHEELCSRQRQSLQTIMEHGEKLAAMIQLRELQNLISQNRSTGVGSPYSSAESEISGSLWDLIQLVGERARRKTVFLMDRDNAEVFYSKVSDLEELFYCLDKQLAYLIGTEMPLVVQIQRTCELSTACVTLVRTAIHYRNEHHLWYPPPECVTPWYSQPAVRRGLWSVASFMLQLLTEISHIHKSRKSDFHSNLEVLAEVLLEAYSGAITAKLERGEEHKGLLDEFWNRRDALLDSIYQLVKSSFKDTSEGTEEQSDGILRELSSNLLSIAKRHEGYQTLWNICCDLNDSELLRNLMHESMGPNGGFSYFVFKQLYDTKQFSKLMRLGEEFPAELATFLKHHRDLLWLHEVFLHQFSSASDTLHVLALSQDDNSIAAAAEGNEPSGIKMEPTLAERKRLLHLSKIAAVAGKNADCDKTLKRIEADLKILKLQEEILQLLPEDEEKQRIGNRLLPPVYLIELCLKSQNRELSLRAFDVFAWTSSSFLKCNRGLLEECWRNVANQDNWGKIYETSISEGWSDEVRFHILRETMLFQASNRCYGPEAETFEGGFEDVLPLRQGNLEFLTLKDSGSSVEAILMQHKDYPDAGKLMLTAIMMEMPLGGTGTEADPSLME